MVSLNILEMQILWWISNCFCIFSLERKFSTSPINKLSDQDLKNEKTDIKTAILMMNMGGPRDENEVQSFLTELFLDRDIIEIPMQKFEEFIWFVLKKWLSKKTFVHRRYLGPFIAKRRSSKVAEKYKATGHLSSLHYWTEKQGEKMIEKLDQISPETGPHQFYLAFRYNRPSLGEAIEQIERYASHCEFIFD